MSEKNSKQDKNLSQPQVQSQPDSPATVMPDAGSEEVYPTLPYTPDAPAPEAAPRVDPDAALEISADGKTFKGSKSSQRFPIANKSQVIVKQAQVQALGTGMVVIPGTEVIQTYSPEVYQKMVDDNFFSDSKMQVEVLHQPAK